MKKLMFAALAVASCSAMAAEGLTQTEVCDLTITKKALAYATKAYTIKIEGESWSNAMEKAEAKFAEITNEVVQACTYDIDYELPEFKDLWVTVTQGEKVKGSIKFTAPAVKSGVASTKVVTTKLNGLYLKNGDNKKTIIWDNVKNEWKLYDPMTIPAQFVDEVLTADGKASLSVIIDDDVNGHNLRGVATGTSDKNTKKIKSVAGNFADTGCKGYGTWKFAYNKKLTGKSDAEIYKAKKLEYAQ